MPGFDDLDAAPVLSSPEVADLLTAELDDWGTFDPQAAAGSLLVVHGEVDESLPPALTAQVVDRLCAAGAAVDHRTHPGAGHDEVMAASGGDAAAWMAARPAGDDPPSTCEVYGTADLEAPHRAPPRPAPHGR